MVKPRAQQPSPTASGAAERRARDPDADDLCRQIGEKLRSMFDDALTDPVPERFHALLDELERKSSQKR